METDKPLPYLREHKDELTGRYRPNSVRRVEIPMVGGKTRQLGIPTVVDRVIPQSIAQILSPLYEPDFSATATVSVREGAHSRHCKKAQEIIKDGRIISLADVIVSHKYEDTTEGVPQCGGCAVAYACVYGNGGNECGLASRTYNDVALQSGRHGSGLTSERVIVTLSTVPY